MVPVAVRCPGDSAGGPGPTPEGFASQLPPIGADLDIVGGHLVERVAMG